MSEIGSSWTPESRLSRISPHGNGDGREDSDRSALRTLVQGMPMFALGVVVTLFSSTVGREGGLALNTPSTAKFSLMDMFAYSLLGLFSTSLASITFRPKLPSIASSFEDITILFIASTFASLLCMVTHVRHHWIVFSACMIPLLPLDRGACMLLLRFFNWTPRINSLLRACDGCPNKLIGSPSYGC